VSPFSYECLTNGVTVSYSQICTDFCLSLKPDWLWNSMNVLFSSNSCVKNQWASKKNVGNVVELYFLAFFFFFFLSSLFSILLLEKKSDVIQLKWMYFISTSTGTREPHPWWNWAATTFLFDLTFAFLRSFFRSSH